MLTFVVTHYRMPPGRLMDFLGWNAALFEKFHAQVLVVSDVPREFPVPWAQAIGYPKPFEIFNLSKTSNFGIRTAGAGIICKTDPDCIFSQEALTVIAAVTPECGVNLSYFMASGPSPEQLAAAKIWEATKGTMALTFDHWAAIHGYDERMQGYGIEDGDAHHRASHAPGRSCARLSVPFWHVAHSPSVQQRGNRRVDLWGKASGFNPNLHQQNQRVRRIPYVNASWGQP